MNYADLKQDIIDRYQIIVDKDTISFCKGDYISITRKCRIKETDIVIEFITDSAQITIWKKTYVIVTSIYR